MDRPRVVVGFCRDWVKYADWLEGELDTAMKVSINDQKMLEDTWGKNDKLREFAKSQWISIHGDDRLFVSALEAGDE
jgi:hypothetical protein